MKLKDLSVYFCTGARNHDLLGLFDEKKISYEIDERVASFKALGAAKISQVPTIVCTTSGTAVSECLSGLIEAYYAHLPLVLISGDRPKKMHGTGAPQTIHHEIITKGHVRTYLDLELSDLETFDFSTCEYPLHLNILIDDTKPHDQQTILGSDLNRFHEFIKTKRTPLFLVSHENGSMRTFTEEFKKRGLNFHAESLSHARDLSEFDEKKLVSLFKKFDSIIRVGHTPLSKIWRLLEKEPKPVYHFDERNLPGMSYGEVMKVNSSDLLKSDFFKILDQYQFEKLPLSPRVYPFGKYSQAEPTKLKAIHDVIPEDSIVYLGNSLSIRFFELIQTKRFRVYGNRGVNGIDGQLATAIGMANRTSDTVYAILGDLTTFYDLSSLDGFPKNLKLVIMNNFGGQIFHELKLDERITLSHKKNFKKIAETFELIYSQRIDDFSHAQVLEIQSSRDETDLFLKDIS